MDDPDPAHRTPWLPVVVAAAGAAAAGLALLAAGGAREAAEAARTEAVAASRAADLARQSSDRAAKEIADLRTDFEVLAANMDAVQRNIKELADRVNFGPGGAGPLGSDPGAGPGEPAPQAPVEFTPELRDTLRRAVAEKGVVLGEDRVSIPGRIVLRQGALEYFAVLPGGKAHESVIVLTGKAGEDGSRPEKLGSALNSCLMALGLRPGSWVRVLPGGKTIPARGATVHLSVEWEEDGKPVRVRAEDMLWDRENGRSMEEGKFIYVGSFFDPQGEGYVPDLSGDAVAVYSVPTCIVDLDDPRAANDTVFQACTPRIPAEGTEVRLVFSPKALEPTRTWDPRDPGKRTDGGGGSDGK